MKQMLLTIQEVKMMLEIISNLKSISKSSPIQPLRVKVKVYATKITLQQPPYPTSYV
jgi:hypothetical protein